MKAFLNRIPSDSKPLFLYILCGLAVFLLFYEPIIYADDWGTIIQRGLNEPTPWILTDFRRPLIFTPFKLIYKLVEFNIHFHFFILFTLHILGGYAFYLLLKKSGVQKEAAFWTGLLYLLYPGDYTHTWLVIIGVRSVILSSSIGLIFWLKFLEEKSIKYAFISLILLIIPLFIYEAQLGLLCLILCYTFLRKNSIKNIKIWFPLFLPFLLFVLFRIFGSGGTKDVYFDRAVSSPFEILLRLKKGILVIYWAWTEPLRQLLGISSNLIVFLFWILLFLSLAALVFGLYRLFPKISEMTISHAFADFDKKKNLKWLGWSLLLTISGYFPVIIYFNPSLGGSRSRFTIFASFGACLFIVHIFLFIRHKIFGSQPWSHLWFRAVILSLLLYSVFIHYIAQKSYRKTWHVEKQILTDITSQIPDIKDNSLFLLFLKNYWEDMGLWNRNWKRAPFCEPWALRPAIQIVYANRTIEAFPLVEKPKTQLWGKTFCSLEIQDIEKAIIYQIDKKTGVNQIIKTPPRQSFDKCYEKVQSYHPDRRIKKEFIDPDIRKIYQ